MLSRLAAMGIRCPRPSATFHVWTDLSVLKAPLDDADVFIRRVLKRAGDDGARPLLRRAPARSGPSPFRSWMRFSFGPPEENLRTRLERLEELVRNA